jgi:hypothetical protein
MITQVCKKCNVEYDLTKEFFKPEKRVKSGFSATCKKCYSSHAREKRIQNLSLYHKKEEEIRKSATYKLYRQTYYQENKEQYQSDAKVRYVKNKPKYLQRSKEQRERLGDDYKSYQMQYRIDHRKELNQYRKNKLNSNPDFKLKHNLRNQFRKLIKGIHKKNSVLFYLDCTVEELKCHLESLFTSEMQWDNWGTVWHIDHKIPCNYFDFKNENDLKKCWNFLNLQPLLILDNLTKSDKIIVGDTFFTVRSLKRS